MVKFLWVLSGALLLAAVILIVSGLIADPVQLDRLAPGLVLLVPGLLTASSARGLRGFTLGLPRFVRRGIGLPARATIVAVAETGNTVSSGANRDMPVVRFTLRIEPGGRPPYEAEHLQSVPRLALPAALPGSHLCVLVSQEDPTSVHIDWSATLGPGVTLPGDELSELAGTAHTPLNPRRARSASSGAELLATGEPGTATIRWFKLLGTVGSLRAGAPDPAHLDHPVYLLALTVHRPGRKPYKARVGHRVPPSVVPSLQPGMTVPVAVDPSRKKRVAIDWGTDT